MLHLGLLRQSFPFTSTSGTNVSSHVSEPPEIPSQLLLRRPPSTNVASLIHQQDLLQQYGDDHHAMLKPSGAVKFFSRFLGTKNIRYLANILHHLVGSPKVEAIRDYPVLPPNANLRKSDGSLLTLDYAALTAKDVAQLYKPKLFSIGEERYQEERFSPCDMRYEVLPPKGKELYYSIIYYLACPKCPEMIPVVSRLWNWFKSISLGSSKDWQAIRVDVNRNTGRPERFYYECSNYNYDPSSYYSKNPADLYLPAQVQRIRQDSWQHTLFQKNGTKRCTSTVNPISAEGDLKFVYVSWAGNLDVWERLQARNYTHTQDRIRAPNCFELLTPELQFLDKDKFSKEGIDLRMPWLSERKRGNCVIYLPTRG